MFGTKHRCSSIAAVALGLALALHLSAARAATYTWSNLGSTWSTAANWGGIAPGGSDISLFNLNGTYTSQPSLAATASVGGLWSTGSGALTLSGSALTLNATTINGNANTSIEMDAAAGPLTITAPLNLTAGVQQWINNSTSPLAINNSVTLNKGATLAFQGSGSYTSTSLSNNNGILGQGFTIGSGTATQYATVSGGTISAYNGATSLVANGAISSTTNYSTTGSINYTNGTQMYMNTLRCTGSSGTLDNTGINNIGFNGLIAAGPAGTTLTIGHNATYNYVTDGYWGGGSHPTQDIAITGPQNVTILANFYGSSTTGNSQLTYGGGGVLTLAFPAASGVNAVAALNVSSGTVVAYGGINSPTINPGGTLQFGDGTSGHDGFANSNVTNNGSLVYNLFGTSAYSGVVSGVGSLSKIGTGTLTLSNVNTYIGTTTVSGGTLNMTTGSNWTIPGNVVINGGLYNLNGGGNQVNLGTTTTPAGITFGANGGTLNTNSTNFYPTSAAGGTLTIATAGGAPAFITGTSNGVGLNTDNDKTIFNVLRGSGTADLTMSAPLSNNVSGASIVKAGNGILEITAGTTSNTAIGANVPLQISAGTLLVDRSGVIGNGNYTGTISNSGALIMASAANQIFGGGISGTGSLSQGSGTVTLSGANNYSGPTTITGGLLVINAPAANDINWSSGFPIASGGTLQLIGNQASQRWTQRGPSITGAGTFLRTGNVYTYFANGASSVTFNQSAGGLADFEAGTSSYIAAATTNLGGLTINNATVTSGVASGAVYFDALNGNSSGVFSNQQAATINVGNNGGSGTFAGSIQNGTGNESFTKLGAGLQVLSGSNTYTGTTTISAGTLMIGSGGTAGSLSASSAISDNATLVFNRSNAATQGTDFSSAAITGTGSLVQVGAGTVTLNAANSYSGGTIINAGVLALGANNALPTSGTVNINGGVLNMLTFSGSSGAITLTGGSIAGSTGVLTAPSYNLQSGNVSVILGGGVSTMTKTTSGLVTLTGASTYGGGTTASGGTLQLGDGASNVGALSGNIANNATLVFANPSAQAYSGAISGSGNVRKTAAGTLNLSGNNTSSGALNVNAGVLSITGSLANPTVTVASGATLTGNGDGSTMGLLAGTVALNGGGAIDFTKNGLSSGSTTVLALGGLTVGDGSSTPAGLTFNLNTNIAEAADLINLGSGTLTVNPSGGTVNVTYTSLAAGTYPLIDYGTLAGSGSITLNPAEAHIGLSTLSLVNTTVNSINALAINVAGNATPALAYWSGSYAAQGGGNANWGGFNSTGPVTNWSLDAGGGTDAGQIVGPASDVVFAATSTAGSISSTLDANYAINSLTVTTSGAVSIGGSQTVTLNAAASASGGAGYTAGTGIVMQPGAGALTISSSVVAAANQSWTNNSSSLLTVSSNVTGGASMGNTTVLTLTGSGSGSSLIFGNIGDGSAGGKLALTVNATGGTVQLTGNNTYTGATTINSGTLLLGNSAAVQNSAVSVNVVNGLAFSAGLGVVSLPGLSGSGGFALNDQAVSPTPVNLLVGSNNASTTYSGAMSGGGSLTKIGGGTLTLTASSGYAGGTTISAGGIFATNASALGSGAVTFNGGALNTKLAGGTMPNAISVGTSGGTLNDSANISGQDVFTGAITGSGALTVNAGTSNSPYTRFQSSNVSGFTGTLNLASGYFLFASTGGVNGNSGAAYLMNGADTILDYQSGAVSTFNMGSLSGSGNITSSEYGINSSVTLSVGGLNTNTTYSGMLQNDTGTLALAKVGSGMLTLTGSNTYSGATNVSGGTLILQGANGATPAGRTTLKINPGATVVATPGFDNQLGNEGNGNLTALNVSGGTFLAGNYEHVNSITMTGGLLGVAAGAAQVDGMDLRAFNSANPVVTTLASTAAALIASKMTLNAPATFNVASGSAGVDLTVAGTIVGGNPLTKSGNGILSLTAASNTYSGSTSVNAGMLVINATAATGNNFGASSGYSVASGGTLQLLSNDSAGNYRWQNGAFQITGAGSFLRSGSAYVYFANGTSAATFNQSAGGLADFEGGQTAYLETATSNLGGMTINSGTAGIQGSVYFDALNGNSSGVLLVNQNPGTLYLGVAGGSGTYLGQIQSSQNLVKQGAGAQVLGGTNTYTGSTSINGGTLQLGTGQSGQDGSLSGTSGVTDNAALVYDLFGNQSASYSIGGSGSLTMTGQGTLTLTNSNGYTGGTAIAGGTLKLGNSAALPIVGALAANGGTLDLAGYSVAAPSFSGAAGTVTNTGSSLAVLTVSQSIATSFNGALTDGNNPTALGLTSGTLALGGSSAYSGGTTLSGGQLIVSSSASLGNAGGALSINVATLEIANGFASPRNIVLTSLNAAIQVDAGQTYANSGAISGTGGLNVTGPGTLRLGGTANSYSGATTVSSGTLQMGAANPLPYGAAAGNMTIIGILDLAGQTANVNGLWGTGTVDNSGGSGTLVVGNNNASSTFSGVLQDSGGTVAPLGLTKTGNGTFTLRSANNYSGLTTVQSGVLYLGASGAAPGPVSVTGGTLDATGFAQSIYSVSMGSLGALNLQIGNLIASAGTDSFAGTLNISGYTGGVQELMSYTGHSGTFTNVTGFNPGIYTLAYAANELEIVVAGAPAWSGTGGSWNAGSNWTSGLPPSGVGVTAVVGTGTGTSVSITLDTPQTLGTLVFSNTAGNSAAGYSLDAGTAGTGSLTLDNSGAAAQITVNAGNHAITAPVYLVGGDLTVSASDSGVLTISGSISQDMGFTRNLALNGDGSGELILSGTNNLGGTGSIATLSSGTLVLNSNEALADGTSLTVGDASTFSGIQSAGSASADSSGAVITLSPVPEPGTLVLLVAGATLLARFRRRR